MSLRCQELCKSFGGREVVHNVSLEVQPGQIVGLLGPNGAGKTTTFSMMVGVESPDSGQVYLGDKCITAKPLHQRARLGIGYLPQLSSVFGKLTVRDNLMIYMERSDVERSQRKHRIDDLLKEFGILHVGDSKAIQLSGGERRRLEVCRALVLQPEYILLDEPFAGIDPVAVEDLQSVVRQVAEKGIGVLITDHNVRETLRLVHQAFLMNQGEVFLSGSPERIASDEKAREVYLGEGFVL